MRNGAWNSVTLWTFALVLTLAGCSGADSTESASAPSTTASVPAPSAEPTPEPTPDPAPVTTTLPPEAMLTGAAFDQDGVDAAVTEPLDAWALPETCAAGAPSNAVASRGVAFGDGAYESTVGMHQVAVFADVETATAGAQRLADVMAACGAVPAEGHGAFVVEDVAVGAQGKGLAVDYYGASAGGDLDSALGYYVATTRRGNAVTLSGQLGGEWTVGVSRTNAVSTSQAAWELLCIYDSAGC